MKKLAALVVALWSALVTPALAVDLVDEKALFISSVTNSLDSERSIVSGRAYLYKVIVSSPGSASAAVKIFNGRVNGGSTVTVVDATAVRDIEYNLFLSSGLRYATEIADPGRVTILYTRHAPIGTRPQYIVYHPTANVTDTLVTSRPVLLYKVIVGKASSTAGSAVRIWNSRITGDVSNLVADVDGTAVRDVVYNTVLSSGMRVTKAGGNESSILYRPLRP